MAFVKRGWGSGAGTGASGGQGGAANPANDRWSLNITLAQYLDNGKLVAKLTGFKATLKDFKTGNIVSFGDDIALNKIDPSVFKIVRNEKTKANNLIIEAGKLDEFRQLLPKILNILSQTNHYTDASIASFADKLDDVLEKTPTPEELSDNTKEIMKNWKELLQALNDPETRKKFLMFQTTYTCESQWENCKLSRRNVSEVLLKDPQASFVTDAPTWFNEFNRYVVNGSPFIIISKPDVPHPPVKDLDNEARAMGYTQGYNALLRNDKTKQIAWGIRKKVAQDLNMAAKFYPTKVYDVRFTRPRDPNHDLFLTVANVINNLTGELNDAAKDILRKDAIAAGKEAPDFDAKKEGISGNEELQRYKAFILTKCKGKKINIPEVGSDDDIIANAIFAYAEKIAEEYNVLSQRAKSAFASAVLYSVALSLGLESSKVGMAANIFSGLSPEESEDVVQKTFEIYKNLATHSLSESVGCGVMSFEQYREALMKLIPNKENVKQNFDAINERLNNVEF